MLPQFESVREAFGIAMPAWSDVGFVLLLGVGIMVTIELPKLVLRRRGNNPQALTVSASRGAT